MPAEFPLGHRFGVGSACFGFGPAARRVVTEAVDNIVRVVALGGVGGALALAPPRANFGPAALRSERGARSAGRPPFLCSHRSGTVPPLFSTCLCGATTFPCAVCIPHLHETSHEE